MVARFQQRQHQAMGLVLGVEIGLGGHFQLAADVEVLERALFQARQGGRTEIDQVARLGLQPQGIQQRLVAQQGVAMLRQLATQGLPIVQFKGGNAAVRTHMITLGRKKRAVKGRPSTKAGDSAKR